MAEGRQVRVLAGSVELEGILAVPERARGVVLFAHGSGSGRFSPRNQQVAGAFQSRGLATLLIDLLTPEEAELDEQTRRLRFHIPLLAERVVDATGWLEHAMETQTLRVGLFGSSTGAAAALVAAHRRPERIAAVVSRGGRVDLAGDSLGAVRAPVLLVVGGADEVVLDLNREALDQLSNEHSRMAIVPGAGHLFEEPGALEMVSRLAADWFERWLDPTAGRAASHGEAAPPNLVWD
ncbi:MAG: dienelactone hydrolase family protein [Deltaproteobacteria bacterium]|nr:dienelactone hydrolase family protein [Deltaproteobacteria bacterium]